ncbi:hypothetical protein SAMN05444169_4901 [Bradyrhizobium erythrophlei]|uniref:Uncharacterized protein n=1 Tax=Bradyrhizobium erythrophlei TaxID=1437360 RepID=A0A1M5NXB3_9BRAD|nr:hypothetical protein SAMN05444169_4901 [Bradyrhizobium erythrophlei]
MASALIGKQAVVIGAGMGGLTAAGATKRRQCQTRKSGTSALIG